MIPVIQAAGTTLSPASVDIRPLPSVREQTVQIFAQSGDSQQEKDQAKQVTEQDVQKAVQQANAEFSGSNERIGFSYDSRLNQLYVRVVDQASGETVREIPPRKFIEHQAAMKEMVGLLLDQKA